MLLRSCGDDAGGERRCYKWPTVRAVATIDRRRCYNGPSPLLQFPGGAATSFRRRCYNCPATLLRASAVLLQFPGGAATSFRPATGCKVTADDFVSAVLQVASVVATIVPPTATSHDSYCCKRCRHSRQLTPVKRRRWLLQAAPATATSGGGCVLQAGRRCSKDTTDATAKGWRRCYFRLAMVLPKASSGAPSGSGGETGMADSGEVSHRNRPRRESGHDFVGSCRHCYKGMATAATVVLPDSRRRRWCCRTQGDDIQGGASGLKAAAVLQGVSPELCARGALAGRMRVQRTRFFFGFRLFSFCPCWNFGHLAFGPWPIIKF